MSPRRFACLLLLALPACATPALQAGRNSSDGPSIELPAEPEFDSDHAGAPPALHDEGDGFHTAAFPTMGTSIQLVLGAPDAATAAAAVQAAREELARLDALLSEWRADSPISAVNRGAGGPPVQVPRELFDLVARSLAAAERSGGAFDPTWASMRGLWKFGDAMDGTVPDDTAIEAGRAKVDWRRVRLDSGAGSIALGAGQALGLGGIAKGHAVDRLAAIFRARGIGDFVIRLGGDLYAAGSRNGRPWRAGIQDPRQPEAIFAAVGLKDQAFSTSGDYERFFVRDGIRYHHIIDPATGRPATRSRSVTVLCPDAITAEVVGKPVFILGPAEGLPFATRHGCEAVVVDAANEVHVSAGLDERLERRPWSL